MTRMSQARSAVSSPWLCCCLSWSSYHRIPSIFTCLLSISAYTLAWIATTSCDFVDVQYTHRQASTGADNNQNGRSYIPSILDVPTSSSYSDGIEEDRSSSQFAQSHSVGLFCPFTGSGTSNNNNIGEEGTLWTISQSFTIITLVLTTLSVILTILISTIVPPNDLNWRVIGYLSTCILLVSVPVFWMLDSDALPCDDGNNAVKCLLGDNAVQWIVQMCLHVVIASITITLQPPNQWAAESDVWKRRTVTSGRGRGRKRNHAGLPLRERARDVAGHIYEYDEERCEDEDEGDDSDSDHDETHLMVSDKTFGQRVNNFFVELLDISYLQETSFFFSRNSKKPNRRQHMNRLSEEVSDEGQLEVGLSLMEDDYDIEQMDQSGTGSGSDRQCVSKEGLTFTQGGSPAAQFDPKLNMMVGGQSHRADDDSMELSISTTTTHSVGETGHPTTGKSKSLVPKMAIRKKDRINRSVPPSLLSQSQNSKDAYWTTNIADEDEEDTENMFDEVNAQFFTSHTDRADAILNNLTNIDNANAQLLGNNSNHSRNKRSNKKQQRKKRRKEKENTDPFEDLYEPPPPFDIDLDLVSMGMESQTKSDITADAKPQHNKHTSGAINIKSLDVTALVEKKENANADKTASQDGSQKGSETQDNVIYEDGNVNLDDDEGSAKAQQILESLLSLPGEDCAVEDLDDSISLDKDELSAALSRVSSMAEDSDEDDDKLHNHFSLSTNRFGVDTDDETEPDNNTSTSSKSMQASGNDDVNTSLASTSPFRSSSNRILMADTSMDSSVSSSSPVLKLINQFGKPEGTQDKSVKEGTSPMEKKDSIITESDIIGEEHILAAETDASEKTCNITSNDNGQAIILAPLVVSSTDPDIRSDSAPVQASVPDHTARVPVITGSVEDGPEDEVIVVEPVIMSRSSSGSSSPSSMPGNTAAADAITMTIDVPANDNTEAIATAPLPIVSPASSNEVASSCAALNFAETCPFDERTRIHEDCGGSGGEETETPFDEETIAEIDEKENDGDIANVSMVPSTTSDDRRKSNSSANIIGTPNVLEALQRNDDAMVKVMPMIISPEKEVTSALVSTDAAPEINTAPTALEMLHTAPSSALVSPLRFKIHTSAMSINATLPPVPVTPDAKSNRAMTPSRSSLPPRPPSGPASADRILLKGRYGKHLWENRNGNGKNEQQTPTMTIAASADAGPDRILADDELEV